MHKIRPKTECNLFKVPSLVTKTLTPALEKVCVFEIKQRYLYIYTIRWLLSGPVLIIYMLSMSSLNILVMLQVKPTSLSNDHMSVELNERNEVCHDDHKSLKEKNQVTYSLGKSIS
jgi:hypothetical protein